MLFASQMRAWLVCVLLWRKAYSRHSIVVSFHQFFSVFVRWKLKRESNHTMERDHSTSFKSYLTKFTYCFFESLLPDRCLPSSGIDCSAIRMQLCRDNWRHVCFGVGDRLWLQNPWWMCRGWRMVAACKCTSESWVCFFHVDRPSLGPKWCHKKCFRFFAFCFVRFWAAPRCWWLN